MAKQPRTMMTTTQEIEALRADIVSAKAEIAETERASAPREEAIERIRSFVALEAARRPPAGRSFAHATPARVSMLAYGNADEVLAWLAAAVPEKLQELFIADVDRRLAEAPAGLPAAEREERVAMLEARLRSLEAREERLLREAETAGVELDRRADAAVEIIIATDQHLSTLAS